MYNEFIKKITANLNKYINYDEVVDNAKFNIVDDEGNDITQEIKDIIDGNKEGDPELLRYLFSKSTKDTGIATLQYLDKHPEKIQMLLRFLQILQMHIYQILILLYTILIKF